MANIIYTITDEAPALATRSFLPIVKSFLKSSKVHIDTKDLDICKSFLAKLTSFSGKTECTIEKSTLDLGIQHTLSYLFDDHYVFCGRRRTYSCVVFLSMHQRSTLFSTGRTSSIPRRSRRPPGQIEAHPSLKRGRGRLLGFAPPPRRN